MGDRRLAVLLLSLTVGCAPDLRGLTGGGGSGGAAPATGTGGSTNVGGTTGTGGSTNVGGTTGTAGTTGMAGTSSAAGIGGTGAGGAGGGGQVGGIGGSGCCTVGPFDNGQACVMDTDCKTGHCFDGTCCSTECSGVCRTCANSTGTCMLAPKGVDPRDDCAVDSQNVCGNVGTCDGSGACAMASAGTTCGATPTCDSTNASVIASMICSGTGSCVAGTRVSCKGFACNSGACEASCSDDSACATGGFCSAHTCVVIPNLAGNGDLETGTLTGWSAFAGAAGPLMLSTQAASGSAHTGQFSVALSGRTQYYQGPSYSLPTGLGKYSIGVWAMQMQDTGNEVPSLLAQIRLLCAADTVGSFATVQMTGFGMSAPAGTWVHFGADVDTKAVALGPTCVPDGHNGAVRSATLFISQTPPSSTAYPALYVDDLVVQSTDGHNLIGNPNFEAGVIDGWSTTGGASALAVSNTVAHGGQNSLSQTARTLPSSAIAYGLPIGAARYAVSLWVLQSGTMSHQLGLLPLYSCIGDTAVRFATPSAAVTASPSAWTQLTGTFVLPPADAPAGCVLSQASVVLGQAETGTCGSTVECPDLFVDDAAITLK